MRGLGVLLGKELLEQVRTYRWLIVGGVFLFFGITTPLMLKYLPQIIKLAGEQIPIDIPPPSPAQSLAEFGGTAGQIGLLMAVLVAMGAVANEMKSGTFVMTLSKPASYASFVTAKILANSLTFAGSLFVASAFCYAYTVWLIGDAGLKPFLWANLLIAAFIIFCLAVTLFYSSLFRSSLAAGGLAIATLIAQAALAAIPVVGEYVPGKLLGWAAGVVAGDTREYWWALGVAAALVGLSLYFAQALLRKRDV